MSSAMSDFDTKRYDYYSAEELTTWISNLEVRNIQLQFCYKWVIISVNSDDLNCDCSMRYDVGGGWGSTMNKPTKIFQMVMVKMTILTITIIPFLSPNGHGKMVAINRYFNRFQQQNNLEFFVSLNIFRFLVEIVMIRFGLIIITVKIF